MKSLSSAKFVAALSLLVITVGCGGEPDTPRGGSTEFEDPSTAVAAAADPLVAADASACALDIDCEAGLFCFQGVCAAECQDDADCPSGSCGVRGECSDGSALDDARGGAFEDEVLADLRIVKGPETVLWVRPGQTSVAVEMQLNDEAPAEGVAYILRRADQEGSETVVRRMRANGTTVSFDLEAGEASPDASDPRSVRIEMVSSVGSMTFALSPERAATGAYSGDVLMETFGAASLPIEFSVATRPDGSTLSEAEAAWIVLGTGDDQIFAPTRGEGVPETVAAPLAYDDFTQTWVANFRGAFDLSDGLVMQFDSDSQIQRQLRFELTIQADGSAAGSVRDTWTGLYESRSSNGVLTLGDVIYRGELLAEKVDSGPSNTDIDTDYVAPVADPQIFPVGTLNSCDDTILSTATFDDGTLYDCGAITTATFASASPEEQARCAIAVANTGLQGETTAGQIRTYLEGGSVGGKSFAEFMTDCAGGVDGLCRPNAEVGCARELLSEAYRAQGSAPAYVDPLLGQFLEISRESVLGRQFGALQTDTETRLEWLKTSDYPAIVTTAVRNLNEMLLDDWQVNVLDVHFSVLQEQFDPTGLIVLARQPEGQDAVNTRGELLFEMNQSFRTAMESLTTATRRWDVLYLDAGSRSEKAEYVSGRVRDLYILSGVLQRLNLEGGQGFLSAGIGAGFGTLLREHARLNDAFNELIYGRDAEVVVATSVDPTVSNATLLNKLEGDARDDIELALETVGEVIEEDGAEALSEAELRNRLNNEIDDLKGDLIDLCGLPRGCSIGDVLTDECQVRVRAGRCGFVYSRGRGELDTDFPIETLSASDGGKALLAIIQSANDISIAHREVFDLGQRLRLRYQQTSAFVGNLSRRAELRAEKLEAMADAFDQIAANREDEIGVLAENIALRARNRAQIIEGSRTDLAAWDTIKFTSLTAQMGLEIAALATGQVSAGLDRSAQGILNAADAFKDGLPTSKEDIGSAAVRLSVGVAAVNGSAALSATSQTLDSVSQSLSLASDQAGKYTDATLESLMAASDIGTAESEDEITALAEQAKLATIENAAEREAITNALALAKEEREIQLAALKEGQELLDRRVEIKLQMQKLAGLKLRVAGARIQYQQRLMDYASVTQRAQIVDAKLRQLDLQRQNINQIVGSPAAVFQRANRITRAENKLENAKDSLMEWLVGLEYYAVRPFMDQRIQVLLARNPYQLEKIADELGRLQSACGGSINTFTAELSVRDDFLSVTQPQADLDGAVLEPAAVFRELLGSGYIPVDKRVRYTTDESIGDLLQRDAGVLSASFYVDLDDFANLAATCNAKIGSLDLQLVGDIGEGRPTVSVLYDGTGELRSCQPGIDAYVSQFGEGTTSFGSITYVRASGRSVSPVAGIGEFIDDSANTTLAGLPLSSQYTVMIDTQLGENKNVDWSQLEDIQLRVNYSYQDLFPEGQCQ